MAVIVFLQTSQCIGASIDARSHSMVVRRSMTPVVRSLAQAASYRSVLAIRAAT